MWAALLTACWIHKDLKLGKLAAEKLYGREPVRLTNYIVLLKIYNSCGQLKEAAGVVQTLRRKGCECSRCVVGLKSRNRLVFSIQETRLMVKHKKSTDELMAEISKHGYIPEQKSLLPHADEHEERKLQYHSEKLL